MKLWVGILLLSLTLVVTHIYSIGNNGDRSINELKVYQGPVPLGYDLEHFRKTGITIEESVLNG
jgi:hypothetical protein